MDDKVASPASDSRQEKRQDRWRRNKQAERARKRPPEPPEPPPPSEDFVALVLAERDRRRENFPHWLDWEVKWEGGSGSYEFKTDVWAARTILEKQFGEGKVSAGRVARWMTVRGMTYGYEPGSLRTMVWRAFKAIEILETFCGRRPYRRGLGPAWKPFEPGD